MSVGIDFIAHHSLQAQAAQSVFDALQARFPCRWRLGADQAADGAAQAAVLLDHRAFHPRLRKSAGGYRYLFHMSHDLGDVAVYDQERIDDFDLVLVPGRRHRAAAQAALGSEERVVEIGWPKFDPQPLSAEHAAQIERVRALPRDLTVLYAPTWANTEEWREMIPWLAAMPCNLVVKNHVLVDAGRPFPPGEEVRYASLRRSIDAMEDAVRTLASEACIVLSPALNLCALFPHIDALITDSSSCAIEFAPFGPSIATGRTGAGSDPERDTDLHASELCAAVQHIDLPGLRRRFATPQSFAGHFGAGRPSGAPRGASDVIADVTPGAIGPGAARLIEAHMARYPQGAPILVSGGEPGGVLEIGADTVRRKLHRRPWREVEPVLRRIPGIDAQLVPWTELSAAGDWVTLEHPRLRVISYPHEWCAEMLFDAALAHARLMAAVAPHGLALKDAHPWNVLFDGTRPVFIDVGSIEPQAELARLDYLQGHPAGPAFEILQIMLLPYFVLPLCFHRAGLGAQARSVLWRFALNGAPRHPRLRDFLSGTAPTQARAAARGIAFTLRATWRFRAIGRRLPPVDALQALAAGTADLLATLAPTPGQSGYTVYYAAKGEAQDFAAVGEWNAKQRNVAAALDGPGIATVLDVACNTGWYARLAARRGKRVTALDVDAACVSTLYRAARDAGEDIVPLVMDIAALSPDRERRGGGLLMIAAERRLQSDLVLALGILHHLVLGTGLSLEDALARLSAHASRRLVVEFVGLEDDKVRGVPEFFPALARRPADFAGYDLEAARSCLAALGWRVELQASHPATRTLLVCDRMPA